MGFSKLLWFLTKRVYYWRKVISNSVRNVLKFLWTNKNVFILTAIGWNTCIWKPFSFRSNLIITCEIIKVTNKKLRLMSLEAVLLQHDMHAITPINSPHTTNSALIVPVYIVHGISSQPNTRNPGTASLQ
jgi:hypothetical protein